MAFASETLLPSVLILVAFPPLNIAAIAAVGVSETPTATPAALRAEPLETLLPASVPRSVTVYCCALPGAAQANRQHSIDPVRHPGLIAISMCVSPCFKADNLSHIRCGRCWCHSPNK